jgi:hypothetical protein
VFSLESCQPPPEKENQIIMGILSFDGVGCGLLVGTMDGVGSSVGNRDFTFCSANKSASLSIFSASEKALAM